MIQDKFKFFNKLWTRKPYYTFIPEKYFRLNDKIKTIEYVKSKLGKDKIDSEDLEAACKTYPEIFYWFHLGIHLRPHQHFAIDQMLENTYVAFCWSRRLGKSTIVKLFVLWASFYNKLPGRLTGTTFNIILQDQETANLLYIEPLHEMMERGDRVTYKNFKGYFGDDYFTSRLITKRDKRGKVRSNQITFNLDEGVSRIITMPPTNKAIGREGNIIGDEVSKWKYAHNVKDEFKFYDQLLPVMKENPNFKGIFLSTPDGAGDLFAREIFDFSNRSTNNRYTRIWLPFWGYVDDYWVEEIVKTKQGYIEKDRLEIFRQEYEAEFLTIGNPFFSARLLKNKIREYKFKMRSSFPCSLGIDWGGSQKSRTVLYIIEWDTKPESLRNTIYYKEYEVGEDVEKIDEDLLAIKKRYNIKWVTPDNKGGRWIIPKLEKMFGVTRVEPFNFTTEKRAGYELIRKGINDKIVPVPSIRRLIEQLENLTVKLKPNSEIIGDDIADAFMLAAYPTLKQEYSKFRVFDY